MPDSFHYMYTEAPWFFEIAVLIFGVCIGSFLNVCIYRIPLKKSIVRPASACPHCGTPIKWYDNVPVFGWIFLRGKARCCGKPISFRYPAIEALTAFLFLCCWKLYVPSVALIMMLFVAIMVVITFIDIDHMIIPDRFSIGGMVLGVILSMCFPALHGIHHSVPMMASAQGMMSAMIGAFVGSGLILWIALIAEIIFRKEAMGFGDVKLMGAIGAFLGWEAAIFSIFGGAVIGLIGVVIVKIFQGIFGNSSTEEVVESQTAMTPENTSGESESESENEEDEELPEGALPFGPALAAGAVVYALGASGYAETHFFAALKFILEGI